MARKVFITSDMSIDEKLIEVAETDSLAALLWPWILTTFDDWGRAEASPKRIKAQTFPMLDNVTPEIIANALQLYDRVGLIVLYEVDGKQYMAIPRDKWFKYQTHIRREKRDRDESRYPAPPDGDSSEKKRDDDYTNAQVRADARECATSAGNNADVTVTRAQVREDARICTPSPSPSPSLSPSRNKKASKQAYDARTRARDEPDGQEAAKVMQACERAFGLALNPLQAERLLSYLDDGMEADLLCLAVKKAAMAGKDIRYALGIAESWWQKGIRTLEAAKRERTGKRREEHEHGGTQLFRDLGEQDPGIAFEGYYTSIPGLIKTVPVS